MTATRDTLASLDGRLDDLRREYAWRAIARKLEAAEFRERRRSRRWWLWLLVPATAMAAAAATYPRDALADPARYDLALIAHNGGDDASAIELLDQILSDGSDANVQLAAASLRRMLAAR